MSNEYLFLGGPADGRRVATDDRQAVVVIELRKPAPALGEAVPKTTDETVTRHAYHFNRVRTRSGSIDEIVYTHGARWPIWKILKQLLNNYPTNKPL